MHKQKNLCYINYGVDGMPIRTNEMDFMQILAQNTCGFHEDICLKIRCVNEALCK